MNIIEFELDGGIKGAAQAVDLRGMTRYADECTMKGADISAANQRLFMQSLVELQVDGSADDALQRARKRCPTIAARVVDLLAEHAGLPLPPAMKMVDPLVDPMPPFILMQAGLEAQKARGLLNEYPDAPLRLLQLLDGRRETYFACVLRAPDECELEVVTKAVSQGKGLGAAFLSLADACVVWCRDDIKSSFQRYPAIPFQVLSDEILKVGGDESIRRFRARR